MSAYGAVILDPAEVAASAGRTELDIHSLAGIAVEHTGIDWATAESVQYLADQDVGSVPVDSRRANRTATIPLGLGMDESGMFAASKAVLQEKVALIDSEGGWVKRGDTGLFADVTAARLVIPDQYGTAAGVQPDVKLELDYIPEWYSAEDTSRAVHTETTKPALVFTETLIPGDHPGRLRWILNELQGVDQLGCLYAIRCRHYDSAATAKVLLEAEAMTPLDAAATAAHVGASGGNVLKHPALTTDWTPVLSTDLLVGGSLTHTGSYRVWARCYSASAIPQLRFLWDVGDLASPTVNDAIRLPGAANFYMLDLGAIRLDPSPVGTHRWKGAIQAKADVAGDPIEIDCLFLQDLDEYAGKIVAVQNSAASVGINVLNYAGGGADDAGVGTLAWTNPGNVIASDNAYATAQVAAAGATVTTHYEKTSAHGFAIPSGATINGIMVEVERHMTNNKSPATVKDNQVRLVKAGTVQATDRADTATPWSTSDVIKSYGGPADLWGGTWTPTDVNNAGFGAAISATITPTASSSQTAAIDSIRITIYYTTSGGFSISQDAVVYANQSAELRTDGCYRDSSDGVGSGLMVPIGNLPRIPPSGAEGRTVELAVWLSRGNFADLPDSGIDDMSSQIVTRGAYLFPN